MYHGWLQLGQVEVGNGGRVAAYMRSGVKNGTTMLVTDDSWPFLPIWLGREEEWSTPTEDSDCPWFDITDEASGEFAGVWPLSIEGLDTTPVDRDVVEAATIGGGFGVTRTPPRKISVEAVLVAATPRGLAYGLQWLGAVLRGDPCEGGDKPRELSFLASMPPYDPTMSVEDIHKLGDSHSRLIAEVALTSALKVEEQFSPWVTDPYAPWGEELRGACCAKVSWQMTAGVPWVWRHPIPLVKGLKPAEGAPETVRFENTGKDGSCPSICDLKGGVLVDPQAPAAPTLPRPVAPSASQACLPFQSRRSRWVLEAGRIARWSETIPTVTIRTGAKEERNIRIQWLEGRREEGAVNPCDTVGEVMVSYLPAEAVLTLDAVTGRATVVTKQQEELDAVSVVVGRGGAPWRAPTLSCARAYTLIIDVPQDADAGMRVDVDAVVRQQ